MKSALQYKYLKQEEISKYLEELYALDCDFMAQNWSKNQWEEVQTSNNYLLLVGFSEETLIGFALFQNGPDQFHLLKIVTQGSFQGRGNGKALLERVIADHKRSIYLEVEESNRAAIALYQSMGFSQIFKKENFYSNGENALIFLREVV